MAFSISINSPFLLVFALLMLTSLAMSQVRPTEIITEFYLQDSASGSNATVQAITGLPNKPQSFTQFGAMFAIDDPIMVTPDQGSTEIGRAQGLMVVSSLSGSNVHVSLSLSFAFANGSSLEVQGISHQFERYKELGVVSGTGAFRYAKGSTILESIYYDNRTAYTIIRCTTRITLG